MNHIILVTLSFLLTGNIYCAKILAIYPVPSISHQVVFRPFTRELVRRGHEVVVITTDPMYPKGETPTNLTEIDLHDMSYDLWREKFVFNQEFGKEQDVYAQVEGILKIFPEIIEAQARLKVVQDVIRINDFDLLILEMCYRQALIYSHIIEAPVIQISSYGMMIGGDHVAGTPSHPMLYPAVLRQRLYNLTFWEKLLEFYKYWWVESIFKEYEDVDNQMFRRVFGNDAPGLNGLRDNVDLVLLNTHPVWADNQPWPPNVVSIWGIYTQPSKELPQELQRYLDSSKNGVIYFSLGTNVFASTLPNNIIQTFVNTFASLPYDVLWKWDKDDLPGKSDNIKIMKWIPQPDVLNHPKIKVFITQGGLQSTDEAIRSAVPLIGIPMFADQWYNVEKYVKHKIGLKLDLPTLSEEKLRTAIETIIQEHDAYKKNIVKLREILSDQPQSALDRAVWWTEYVLRHGGAKHLRTRAANMPWTQYYEIPFVSQVLACIVIVVAVSSMLIYYGWLYLRYFIGTKNKVD